MASVFGLVWDANGMGEMKKSVMRIFGGAFLLIGVSFSMLHPPQRHDPVLIIIWFSIMLLIAAIGLWLIVSFFRNSN